MSKDEALRLALEALEELKAVMPIFPKDGECIVGYKDRYNAAQYQASQSITAIKQVMEQPEQEPVGWIDLQKQAQKIVESKPLWKRFIDGTPLANDIACWMADFVQQHTSPPKREPLTDGFGITDMIDVGHYSLQLMFKSRKHADQFKAAHGIGEKK